MKRKTHLTRKNLIFLALFFLFLVVQTFCLLCLDASGGFVKEKNPIAQFALLLGFSLFEKFRVVDYVTFLLVVFWTFMGVTSILYEVRLAKYYEEKPLSKKYLTMYGITILLCLLLSFGLSILLQIPYSFAKFKLTITILWESFILGFIFYFLLASLACSALVLYVNFKNIDKPYRFFGKKHIYDEAEREEREIEEAKKTKIESDLSKSLDIPVETNSTVVGGGVSGTGVYNSTSINAEGTELKDKQKVFPGLCSIDAEFEFNPPMVESEEIKLDELCEKFRLYLANQKLYFDIRVIREFVASFSTTRLVILEGLSGTGKSSLPRHFANFLSTDAFFCPVQATWRDRTSLIGYYNDFSKTFNETDFLKRLYRASYKESEVNLMVLDELNLSRIEYYFADFLSVLEYPSSEWKISLMQLPYSFDAPTHVFDGKIMIPNNTFFVGTANKDDSTYTITDKVYDRAITIDFDDRNEPFEVEENVAPIRLSYQGLNALYLEAQNNSKYSMSKEDIEKFKKLSSFTYQNFDVTFGNRILNQIELFVPTFVACGGTKEEALDFLFSRKILYKLDGRFEDYVKQGLVELKELIISLYPNSFDKSLHEIERMLKRL